MAKFAYPTRVFTAAPFMALALFGLIYRFAPGGVTDMAHFLWSVGFFTLLPLLAYPLSVLIPSLRAQGRSAQRHLAIVFSVIGYFGGITYLILAGGTRTEWMIYLTYAISGVLIALFSFGIGFKASGHACGVAGPVAMLTYCLGAPWAACYLLLAVVFWASLKMKRHTWGQLAVGSLIPVVTIALLGQWLP